MGPQKVILEEIPFISFNMVKHVFSKTLICNMWLPISFRSIFVKKNVFGGLQYVFYVNSTFPLLGTITFRSDSAQIQLFSKIYRMSVRFTHVSTLRGISFRSLSKNLS